VLTDQAYAIALARFTGREPIPDPGLRLRYYLGTALTFWATWQTATLVGAVGGGSIPDSIPLDFAIPLAFLALLVPAVTDRPTVLAAVVGGVGTVVAAELGAGDLSLVLGASAGIVAGTVAGAGADPADQPLPGREEER
jgi:predicted branched-subunit amino acid permease